MEKDLTQVVQVEKESKAVVCQARYHEATSCSFLDPMVNRELLGRGIRCVKRGG